jgi:glycosyltransferase involved in cell wall biosynthesis
VGSTHARRGRVAIVSHGFYPSVGGSERYHLFTARALADEADVRVFTSDLNLPSGGVPTGNPGVAVEYLPSIPIDAERLIHPGPLWQALRKFDPDVVWGNHPSPTADLGAMYALLRGRPWVATYHADISAGRWRNRRYLAGEMWLLRRASRVLVTSERYRERLATRGVSGNRIVAVPPGPYIGDGIPPDVRDTTGRAIESGRFLFVGALDTAHAYKRLDTLIAAVATLSAADPSVRLDVVGDGDRRAEMERLADRLRIQDRVRFLGRLSDADLAERFCHAMALVLPSPDETEGFGSVAVEAVQYGCPVVVSNRVAVGDLLGPAGAALRFDPSRPEGLTEALRAVADPVVRASLSGRGLAIAPSLRWESLLPALTAPVRELLPRRGATAWAAGST